MSFVPQSVPTRRTGILLSETRTTFFQRSMGRVIDLLVTIVIYLVGHAIWPWLGCVAAITFTAFQDGMGVGQSLGKRIVGIRVVDDETGMPCDYYHSLQRNMPFILGVLFFTVPGLWVFGLAITVPLIILETYLLFRLPSGVRLGDVIGNTLVEEYVDDTPPNV